MDGETTCRAASFPQPQNGDRPKICQKFAEDFDGRAKPNAPITPFGQRADHLRTNPGTGRIEGPGTAHARYCAPRATLTAVTTPVH
jgi:hypothetical protein